MTLPSRPYLACQGTGQQRAQFVGFVFTVLHHGLHRHQQRRIEVNLNLHVLDAADDLPG